MGSFRVSKRKRLQISNMEGTFCLWKLAFFESVKLKVRKVKVSKACGGVHATDEDDAWGISTVDFLRLGIKSQ